MLKKLLKSQQFLETKKEKSHLKIATKLEPLHLQEKGSWALIK